MTWETPWTSHCARGKCFASVVVRASDEAEAIERTKAEGWLVTKGKDAFCPKHMAKQARLEQCNRLVLIIAGCGRRFFYDAPSGRYGHFLIDFGGRLRWHDEYSQKAICLTGRHWYKGFSHGGTLKTIVLHLAEYIRKGTPVAPWYFRPDGYWGYGEDMEIVTNAARFCTHPDNKSPLPTETVLHPCDGCGEDVPTNIQEDGRDLCGECAAYAEEQAIKRPNQENERG